MTERPLIAIACQGGGSHAAFTAGVLAELLSPAHRDRFELLALSGTSGGAVCAGLAWSGLHIRGADEAVRRLEGFWHDLAPRDPLEAWVNAWAQLVLSLPFTAEASPYAYAPEAEPRLRALLGRWMEPTPAGTAPFLRMGVADVLAGGGAVLDGENAQFSPDDIVASAAVPPLFRAVRARGRLWWDGLYAHNPPVAALLDLPRKPDEIWVIRLNPLARGEEPTTVAEIGDRRNEMAGNLPLDQEIAKIALVNRLLAMAPEALGARYRQVAVRVVELDVSGLAYRSKLDRSAAQIERLMRAGRAAAPLFFAPASLVVRREA